MKVSIITVVYNGEDYIESAIKSVLGQDYSNLEYIIVDGGSTDGTLGIIRKFESKIAKIISEPDNGIYDAMNKGLKLANGEVIGVLNSDDFYVDCYAISRIVETFLTKKVESVYGDLVYVKADQINKVRRYWKAGEYSRNSFLYGWMPPHPTFFVKKEVYKRVGFFNTLLRSAADYEFMLRVLYKENTSTFYVDRLITVMRDGGTSNMSLKNRIRGNKEDQLAWKLNGITPLFFTRYIKPLRKIWQYFAKPNIHKALDWYNQN